MPNYRYPSLHIWTKVWDELFDNAKYGISYEAVQKHFRGELTNEAFLYAVFEPLEQVNEVQARLLGAAFMLASGDPEQVHVGTGGDNSHSDLPWGKSILKKYLISAFLEKKEKENHHR